MVGGILTFVVVELLRECLAALQQLTVRYASRKLTDPVSTKGGLIKETWMDEDLREAILKYVDVAAKEPKFIAPTYAKTQPEPLFAKLDSEDEEK